MSLLFIVQRRHFTILSTFCSGSELNHHYSLFCMAVLAANSTRNIVWAAAKSTHAVLNLLNFTSNDFHYHWLSLSFTIFLFSESFQVLGTMMFSVSQSSLSSPNAFFECSTLQSPIHFHIFPPRRAFSRCRRLFPFSSPQLLSSVPLNLLHNYFPSLLE